MLMGRVALSKCLFYVPTQIERWMYSNRTVSIFGLLKISINQQHTDI